VTFVQRFRSKSVLLATPAYETADLLAAEVAPAAERLRQIPYPPMNAVVLAYPTDAFKVLIMLLLRV
jgi:oxygen-dependent protoporphyrinogen oxidase